jgi:uncharacterized protein YdhG (YjbR/CyaY superfamily)
MAKTDYKSVDQYLAAQPEAAQGLLQQVRSTIRKALPGAEEVISYQIPAYKVPGGCAIYFSGWKNHFSLYPATSGVVTTFARELAASCKVEKGTIRFPLSGRPPLKLIAGIAKLRAEEVAAKAAAKSKVKVGAKTKVKANTPRKPKATKRSGGTRT